jgi:hypothetical protein
MKVKRLVTAAVIALAATSAQATELSDQIHAYVPAVAVASVCDVTIDSTSTHMAMLKRLDSEPGARALVQKLHREAQAGYMAAKAEGHGYSWCKDLVVNSKGVVKFRTFIATYYVKLDAKPKARPTIIAEVCSRGPKATGKDADETRKLLAIEYKVAREYAVERNIGLDAAFDEVTDRFCTDVAL